MAINRFSEPNHFQEKVKRDILKNCWKMGYHVYIQRFSKKLVKAGKCVLGLKELPNQLFLKMSEGNNILVLSKYLSVSLKNWWRRCNFHRNTIVATSNFGWPISHSKISRMTYQNIIGRMVLTLFNYRLQFQTKDDGLVTVEA